MLTKDVLDKIQFNLKGDIWAFPVVEFFFATIYKAYTCTCIQCLEDISYVHVRKRYFP